MKEKNTSLFPTFLKTMELSHFSLNVKKKCHHIVTSLRLFGPCSVSTYQWLDQDQYFRSLLQAEAEDWQVLWSLIQPTSPTIHNA